MITSGLHDVLALLQVEAFSDVVNLRRSFFNDDDQSLSCSMMHFRGAWL